MSTLHTSQAARRPFRPLAVSGFTVLLAACSVDSGTAPLTPGSDAVAAARVGESGRVTQYDILDWVLAQGSYCARPENQGGPVCGAVLPGLDLAGWFDPVNGLCGVVDYAGPLEVELGLGFGLTDASDGFQVKVIIAKDLNRPRH